MNAALSLRQAMRYVAFCAIAIMGAASPAKAADPHDSGTTTVVLEYHATPSNRLALRQFMQGQGLKQLEKWKKEGFVRDYKVLFNRFVDNQNWDMLTLVNFPDAAKAAKWKEIEQTMPAGLPPKALALVTSIDTNPADLWLDGGKTKGPGKGVFLVIPYDYLVPTPQYVSYLRGYLLPQLDGWVQEGVLNKYEIYLGRYVVGRHWSALMIYEYNGDEGLGLREKTSDLVRARLVTSDPEWKKWSENKSKLRINRQYIIADELVAN
ncbi:hypothetical protein [Undibacterium sp.]|jgi:hypothetical protein|uniref:hypothetical protein n=1 Tax=Undibacterium sp. TaxID=1914977 RepID=UPI002BF002FD|nr:hypothetical protein [Undibacterium sp.]HTD05206.1 hypothetical protein [Undibacterium sp.]